jgi:hypothetical protein
LLVSGLLYAARDLLNFLSLTQAEREARVSKDKIKRYKILLVVKQQQFLAHSLICHLFQSFIFSERHRFSKGRRYV